MSAVPSEDQLARRRVIVVILRLLVGPGGQLVQGEVVDLEGASQGRFLHWPDLHQLLRRWLQRVYSEIDVG